ncbi:B-cell scaffold protein [Mactra antiquata]
MARPRVGKKDMLILYEESDSEQWVEYLKSCINDCPESVTSEALDLTSNIETIHKQLASFTMVLLVTSQNMLKTLQDNSSALSKYLEKHKGTTLLKLYLDDINIDKELFQYYNGSNQWKCFSIGNEDTVKEVDVAISQILNALQEINAAVLPPPPAKSYIQSVCPDCIRQGGETVILVLRKPVKEGQTVQIRFGSSENGKLIDTEILNEYCCRFKAPANKAGKISMYLFLDGRKMCRHPIRYSSMTKFAYTYPEFLCQLIGLNHDDRTGLDKELTAIFKNSAPQDGTLEALLTPRALKATSTASVEGKDVGELPTLLHFACKYGLNDLATSIIDTPGAYQALHTDNERGLKPIHLAEETNNEDLANYIESYMEMHDYVTEVEDLYEKMSGRSLRYDNTDNPGPDPSGYMVMKHKQRVQEAYVAGRLAGTPEDDYEITSTPNDLVQEVSVEEDVEDVAPDVPARLPKHKPSEIRKTIALTASGNGVPDDNWHTYGCIPSDDKVFAGNTPLSPQSMGSNNLDELNQYADAYKAGEFTLDDVTRLFQAWQIRTSDSQTMSMKERKKQMDEFKKEFASSKMPKKKKSVFPWKKKAERPQMNIEHNVEPNKYETWTIMRDDKSPYRVRCDSLISNASTTSSSSSSSRDSGLDPVHEGDFDVPAEAAPPVPLRREKPGEAADSSHRKSLGDQFLYNTKKKPKSQLPTPPSQNRDIYSRAQTSSPVVPPRPPRRM